VPTAVDGNTPGTSGDYGGGQGGAPASSGVKEDTADAGNTPGASGDYGSGQGGVPASSAAKEESGAPSEYIWNYWLTAQANSLVPMPSAQEITLNVRTRVEFRLSSFDLGEFYNRMHTLAGSPPLGQEIDRARADPLRRTLDLDVLVQSTDDSRLLIDPSARRQHLSIDLDAHRGKPPGAPKAGTTPSSQLLKAARFAEFGIDLTVLAPGTHEVGIVIVDASSGFPLQTMVASITDASSGTSGVTVRGNGQLGSIAGSAPADLSLYLYDLASQHDDLYQHSLHAQLYYRTARGYDLVAWRADFDLAGLRGATGTFKTVGSISSAASLLRAGASFGRLLFNPVSPDGACDPGSNCAAARQARAVITAAANYPAGHLPPTMVVHIISGETEGVMHYASDVFPFGAMGVALDGGSKPVYLGERFALALVLSDQQFSRTTTCPSRWYFAVPESANHVDEGDPLRQALHEMAPLLERIKPVVRKQSDGLDELGAWLKQSDPVGQRSYVLAYLGHHEGGYLYLREDAGGIDSGSIERTFERASIAIIDACTSAMSAVSNGTPVGRLARLNVDSTIATTSAVSGELAADYLDCLDAVLDDPRRLTVGQAHALATQCLWSSSSSARWHRHYDYQGAALKYLLIGDPNQPLCSPTRRTSP
jgi:hypothetical protein